jgi:hypothetical protein
MFANLLGLLIASWGTANGLKDKWSVSKDA